MRFDGGEFFLFVIALIIICKMVPSEKWRRIILVVASVLFYTSITKMGAILLVCEVVITYFFSKWILLCQSSRRKKVLLIISIASILSILLFWKYKPLGIFPVGLSFYSLEAIACIIEIYCGNIKTELSIKAIASYLCFFPTITSGPIKNTQSYLDNLYNEHPIKWKNIEAGFQVFLMGLMKKKVIADHLAIGVNAVYNAPGAFDSASVWLAVIGYSLQIYFDFSGYSDMAIGIGKMLGFEIPRNFNFPFLAQNPSDFWKRWHISLSTWLKQYVYIPLGGNKGSVARTCFNIFITMIISGIWHGNGWTFILWGAWHGMGSIIYRLYKSRNYIAIPKPISVCLTNFFVMIGWILFRADSINKVGIILTKMFVLSSGIHYMYIQSILSVLIICLTMIYLSMYNNSNGYYVYGNWNKISNWFIFWICIFISITFYYIGDTSFIYAQF